ncbi:MBL fold metallo-hydrolase [Chloroflexota bacterium]
MQQITPNVYVDFQFSDPPLGRGSNPGFVVTSEGIVMIDTPMLPTYAIRWRDELAKRGEIRYIINTEYHVDHFGGNYFFPGPIISHQGVREILSCPVEKIIPFGTVKVATARSMDLREYILWRYEELDPEGLTLTQSYEPRLPTITFSERLTLYVGDHTFELIHLPGHTPYQALVYIPQERVVFTGDNFSNKVQASLAQCLPLEWIESLGKIEALDVDFFIPGHGPLGNKTDLREFTQFIQGVIDTVRQAINQGLSKEETADKISFEDQRPARHAGAEQQRMNIMHLYDMLSR